MVTSNAVPRNIAFTLSKIALEEMQRHTTKRKDNTEPGPHSTEAKKPVCECCTNPPKKERIGKANAGWTSLCNLKR